MDSKTHQVMIVDDHPIVREGLKVYIATQPDLAICAETGSIRAAQQLVRKQQPDLIIVDLFLEDGNGLELIKRLRYQYAELKILVCSMSDEMLFAERAVNAGANGYINKQEVAEHVVTAVRQILAGKIYFSPNMVQHVISGFANGVPITHSPIDALSDRELEVFTLIGKGHATSKIAAQLHLSVKTIETHRDKIKRKLGLTSGNQLVRHAVQWDLEKR